MIEILLQAESALSVGLLDRAEALYQHVVGADPRNSIAVVGLARVALERSDEVGALTIARRALAIDPENNAAQRMVQRLEEVLQTRGVAVAPAGVPDAPDGSPPAPTTQTPTTPGPTTPQARHSPDLASASPEPVTRSCLDRLLRRRRNRS